MRELLIKGIKVHNLKNIDISIPLNSVVVVTGLSGSGKSSLVFDTIYAESSRRFIESLGAFSRQYLPRLPAPEIEAAENIPPAIAVRYLALSRSSRSTVGTSTEIYDYLRLLFARIGVTVCSRCGLPIEPVSPSVAADKLIEEYSEETTYITFKITLSRRNREEILQRINGLAAKGYYRALVQSKTVEIRELIPKIKKTTMKDHLDIIIDRLIVKGKERSRIAEDVETAYREADGLCTIFIPSLGENFSISEGRTCSGCGTNYPLPRPSLFSFNSPFGACPDCRGFGDVIYYDINKIINDKRKSLIDGAIGVLEFNRFKYAKEEILELARRNRIPVSLPIGILSKKHLGLLWNGDGVYDGISRFFERLERKRYRVDVRTILARNRSYKTCSECGGSRLRKEALNVKIEGKDIGIIVNMPFTILITFVKDLVSKHDGDPVSADILEQIERRVEMLVGAGVGYLTLNRMTRTLSRGELQRINLINAAGARLTGTLYLMDEPSVGLHPMDEEGLLNIIRSLKNSGNTVMIAEHSSTIIKMADYIIELGPKAGEEGGRIVFSGNLDEFIHKETLTSRYISEKQVVEIPSFRRQPNTGYIEIKGAAAHNLKNVNVSIPVGLFTCITGPSGAGKSSLMLDVLYNNWRKNWRQDYKVQAGACVSIDGLDKFRDFVLVEGGKITSSSRSCVATYIGIFSEIRQHFAGLRTSALAGLETKDFSFNTVAGRCPDCRGRGKIIVDLQFLPDVSVVCERCRGTRFREAPLNHRFMGFNIAGVLELTVEQARELFRHKSKLVQKLRLLEDVNLGYLPLGQPLDTLSSGEASRLALARIIGRREMAERLFLFDEPSIGLHPFNVSRLLKVFTRMIAYGATIVCIEHNPEIIKNADFVIDMGPKGGEEGGRVLAIGTPEEIAENSQSVTGPYLKPLLGTKKVEAGEATVYTGYPITR